MNPNLDDELEDAPPRPFVKLCEVGPRDGLQNEATIVPTAEKIAYIDLLSRAGFVMIETTSFVRPTAIPALADAEDVMRGIARRPGVTYLTLVPNERGFERALQAGVKAIAVFTAASEPFVQANIGMSIAQSLKVFAPIVARARTERLFVRGYVSTAFGCPFSGKIAVHDVVSVSEHLADLGIDELSIGDTIGVAHPAEVRTMCEVLQTRLPLERLAMHFHDTQGRALENIEAAYEMGIRTFDTASGGLGGCPYAPGASGNVATEAVVDFFERKGITTGIDAETLRQATSFIRKYLS